MEQPKANTKLRSIKKQWTMYEYQQHQKQFETKFKSETNIKVAI